MEDLRSKSCGHNVRRIPNEIEHYFYPSFASNPKPHQTQMGNDVNFKFKKRKSMNTSSPSKSWSFSDPGLQRKKRLASYKVYDVEGKLKSSLRKSFKWLKNKYTRLVYGL